jgi:ElaB/YqjD/DUF883 family membrane-anchored ribosome-binding protein
MQTTQEHPSVGTALPSGALDEVTRSASELGSGAIHRVADGAHQAVDQIVQGAGSALETLGDRSEAWKAASEEALEPVYAYVRDKPLLALGVAAAAGFLLGRLMP